MPNEMDTLVPFKPGEHVAIVEDAQPIVGAAQGIVVGDTLGRPDADEVKVVIALDAPTCTNAVLSPADLQAAS